jgi:hypothetical protein
MRYQFCSVFCVRKSKLRTMVEFVRSRLCQEEKRQILKICCDIVMAFQEILRLMKRRN